jgi:hypothetical protein
MPIYCDEVYFKASGKGFYDWSDPRNPAPRDLSHYVLGTAEQMTAALK